MNKIDIVGKVQVESDHYTDFNYDTFERWSSYWHQIEAIRSTNPRTLLEIGVGTGLTTWYARNRLGIDVTTCDFDSTLRPDITADVRSLSSAFPDRKFDTVVAFQVLEHLPFSDFPECILQLSQVTNKHVVISLPHTGWRWGLSVRIRSHIWKFGRAIAKPKKNWDLEKDGHGEHYWEIGVKGSTLSDVLKVVEQHFNIIKHYFVPENPYHCFFVLSKK